MGMVWDEKNNGKLLDIGGIGGNIVGCWRFFGMLDEAWRYVLKRECDQDF